MFCFPQISSIDLGKPQSVGESDTKRVRGLEDVDSDDPDKYVL